MFNNHYFLKKNYNDYFSFKIQNFRCSFLYISNNQYFVIIFQNVTPVKCKQDFKFLFEGE